MKKLTMHTPDQVQGNIASIRELFPHCVTEGKDEGGKTQWRVDFDLLRQELSGDLIDNPQDERYHINWPGKREALVIANSPIAKTLRPCQADSVQFDTTQNLYIEGDNLDALKLLQNPYLGKVKMIYIDPPYNTGHDFIYKDNFSQASKDYLQRSNQTDEEGARLVENTEANGRFHSDWLSMMYPRLKLARHLLSDDGAIFISIDDNEQANLKRLCDEVFGEGNFVGQIIPIANPGGRDYTKIATMHEYLLVYSKTNNLILNELNKDIVFKKSDPAGGYELRELRNRNPKFHSKNRPNLFYPFYVNPLIVNNGLCAVSLKQSKEFNLEVYPHNSIGQESVWRWGKSKSAENIVFEDIELSQIVARQKSDGNWNIYEKSRKSTTKIKSLWDETSMRTEDGTRLVRNLFNNENPFDHPKSLSLIQRCLNIGSDNEALILDFFSGSSTTAHAVMQLNAEDGGNRKFIMVQLPEQCAPQSEAYKAGFATIAEIGKERIRRAGQKITQGECHANWAQDIGFRVLKIDSANISDVALRPQDTQQHEIENLISNIKPDRTPEDLLFQAMLSLGLDLSCAISTQNIGGHTVYAVQNHAENEPTPAELLACFSVHTPECPGIDNTFVQELAKQKPLHVVFRDEGFKDSASKLNAWQFFKMISPHTEVHCL